MKSLGCLALLLQCLAALAASADYVGGSGEDERGESSTIAPRGVALFDLHDPELMGSWADFLEKTPMLNAKPLPSGLQGRLTNDVVVYQYLTPADQPAFFVATYFDVLIDNLLVADGEETIEIRPMQVCPVFTSGKDPSVSSHLAVATGLPDELFANAPGRPERYRNLFLQTEYSHCRFLAAFWAVDGTGVRFHADEYQGKRLAHFSFEVGSRSYTACVGTRDELRALLEVLGDVDAISRVRGEESGRNSADETEVFSFARLLALLATDSKNGYAAIPVLYPMLNGQDDVHNAERGCLPIADALKLAYKAREAFRQLVTFSISDVETLSTAKLTVMRALSDDSYLLTAGEQLTAILHRFVTGADLLLAPTLAYGRMPPVND
jgi:hypothetical protein